MAKSKPSKPPASSTPRPKTALSSVFGLGGVFLCCFGTCGGNYVYMLTAPPLRKTVALVESSPAVREAIGGDVDVSLAVARRLERDIRRPGGRDRVVLLTDVDGAIGEATLGIDAENVGSQGWAGTFRVTAPGRQVLENGTYRTVGGGTILHGTFAPDGTPVVEP